MGFGIFFVSLYNSVWNNGFIDVDISKCSLVT